MMKELGNEGSPEIRGSQTQIDKKKAKEYLNDLYHNTPQFDEIVPTFN